MSNNTGVVVLVISTLSLDNIGYMKGEYSKNSLWCNFSCYENVRKQ
jgi:hypothetical protein